MSRDRIEITAKIGNIDGHVHGRLAAINTGHDAPGAGGLTDGFHVHYSTQDVGQMRDRDHPRARRHRVDHGLWVKITVRVAIDPNQLDPQPLTQKMPRNDVGVMLHDRQDDLIPGLEVMGAPAIGHEVKCLGRTRGEHDLILIRNAQELGDLAAHGLVFVRSQIAQIMQAPMHVGVFVAIGLRDRVDHNLGLLRAGPVVQIDQRLAIHLARQDRKIGAYRINIVGHSECPSGGQRLGVDPENGHRKAKDKQGPEPADHNPRKNHARRLEAVQNEDEIRQKVEKQPDRGNKHQQGQERCDYRQHQLRQLHRDKDNLQPHNQQERFLKTALPAARAPHPVDQVDRAHNEQRL